MISLDTNVIVRFLTADDQQQFRVAKALFERCEVVVVKTVFLETEWVLRYCYDYSESDIIEALSRFIALPKVHLKDEAVIQKTLIWQKNGMDFADAIHLASDPTVDAFLTFDEKMCDIAEGSDSSVPVRPAHNWD